MVEDEAYLAMLLNELLTDAGYRVMHAARLDAAFRIADEHPIEGALLDINVDGELVYPLADRLRAQGVPFMFVSAYPPVSIPATFRDQPLVQKPYTIGDILDAVATLLGESPPLPDGAASHP